jgi:hypothetical protein
MKLRTIGMAVVAALALVAGRAEAQEAGWDTKYGILFGLGVAPDVLRGYSGKLGAQYNMTPTTGLRLAANIFRGSSGILDVNDNGVKSKVVPPVTSAYDVNLAAQYVIRMSTAAVAPYGGVGAFIDFSQWSRSGDAENAGVVTTYDTTARSFDLGAMATAGLEWRINAVVALFAEYQANLTLYGSYSLDESTKVGAAAPVKYSESSNNFLGLTTGIGQAGRVGLVAFF